MSGPSGAPALPPFDRNVFWGADSLTRIGSGPPGGKAAGLIRLQDGLPSHVDGGAYPLRIAIPSATVITADQFEFFLDENGLWDVALSGAADDEIARAFLRGSLPGDLAGNLRALVRHVHSPLAIRSSGLLEDAREHPFAGVYATKMTPNDQFDVGLRFRRLVEAVKFVWASTFFRTARAYRETIGAAPREERMAVIVQEIVGVRRGPRFYPDLSGVARSYNFYRFGAARPEEGVAHLALGLGRTIVEGEASWAYCPAHPRVRRPYGTLGELLRNSQTSFWAVRMGPPPVEDPLRETEYLVKAGFEEAEEDESLRFTASTLDAGSDRLVPGAERSGPRLLDFAPLLALEEFPVNAAIRTLLAHAERVDGGPVEIEFAATFHPREDPPGRLGLLQVRPLVVSTETVDLDAPRPPGLIPLVTSGTVLGNGVVDGIEDLVYLRPDAVGTRSFAGAASEVAEVNRTLLADRRPFVLIGFGRWGSADPWLGIPVAWGDVGGARVLVEAALAERSIELSQGSHFFHNISSFRVSYFSVPAASAGAIDWGWLSSRPALRETSWLRHVRLPEPLRVEVDGRSGRGIIFRREQSS
ncbi:MAG: PEP/pyruvate-binding domain-containing protein [Thermoanaerobaculia bacterium]